MWFVVECGTREEGFGCDGVENMGGGWGEEESAGGVVLGRGGWPRLGKGRLLALVLPPPRGL